MLEMVAVMVQLGVGGLALALRRLLEAVTDIISGKRRKYRRKKHVDL
jgi:hypothetical protein